MCFYYIEVLPYSITRLFLLNTGLKNQSPLLSVLTSFLPLISLLSLSFTTSTKLSSFSSFPGALSYVDCIANNAAQIL